MMVCVGAVSGLGGAPTDWMSVVVPTLVPVHPLSSSPLLPTHPSSLFVMLDQKGLHRVS